MTMEKTEEVTDCLKILINGHTNLMDISGELVNLFDNYLSGRFQRVALNGQN